MKVLCLPRYDRLGASSRLRFFQYFPYLTSAGFEIDVQPLFTSSYISALQRGKKSISHIAFGYARRVAAALKSTQYDLLWVEKELLPWLPASIETLFLRSGAPLVIDYDDAVFHYYDLNQNPLIRRLLGEKHRRLMSAASQVIVGNDYLAACAMQRGARKIDIIPTGVDIERYEVAGTKNVSSPPKVVWIGQRSTARFLAPLTSLMIELVAEKSAIFHAVGVDASALGLPMTWEAWTEESEAAALANCDIGIMPLLDEPFERGKCGYKLVQYMASGLPVVASPVGANREIVQHGVNGYLASTPNEWSHYLKCLSADPQLRRTMGAAGRKMVENKYSVQANSARLIDLLRCAASNRHPALEASAKAAF